MSYKKIILMFLSMIFLVSCTQMTINSANRSAIKNEYYEALSLLDEPIREKIDNENLVKSYQEIFNKGKIYYSEKNDMQNLFLLEKLYLDLPNKIKDKLFSIEVDVEKHEKNGKIIANKLFEEAGKSKENTYKEKVAKYRKYKKIFVYNPQDNKVKNELDRLDKNIEKTYIYRINGDDYLLNKEIEDNITTELKNNNFKYSNKNPDLDLEINLELLNYNPAKVNMQSFPRQNRVVSKNNNGKEVVDVVNYIENRFTNSTDIRIKLKYKLISNISREVIFSGEKTFEKEYEEKWKTYYVISGKVTNKIPKDETEKPVPSKKKMISDIKKDILNYIDSDFKNLPVYKR